MTPSLFKKILSDKISLLSPNNSLLHNVPALYTVNSVFLFFLQAVQQLTVWCNSSSVGAVPCITWNKRPMLHSNEPPDQFTATGRWGITGDGDVQNCRGTFHTSKVMDLRCYKWDYRMFQIIAANVGNHLHWETSCVFGLMFRNPPLRISSTPPVKPEPALHWEIISPHVLQLHTYSWESSHDVKKSVLIPNWGSCCEHPVGLFR